MKGAYEARCKPIVGVACARSNTGRARVCQPPSSRLRDGARSGFIRFMIYCASSCERLTHHGISLQKNSPLLTPLGHYAAHAEPRLVLSNTSPMGRSFLSLPATARKSSRHGSPFVLSLGIGILVRGARRRSTARRQRSRRRDVQRAAPPSKRNARIGLAPMDPAK